MTQGRTIRLYLIDGTPNGAIATEIINWTGRISRIPRTQLHTVAHREEIKRTGVYILTGPDPDGDGERVYIGETDVIYDRLKQPDHQDRDFWTHAITISSSDDNVTKAHARYLEHRLLKMAKASGRAILDNTATPKPKSLPESDRADMEYFIEQVKLVLPVLGCNILKPTPVLSEPEQQVSIKSPKLLLNEVGVTGVAYEVDGQFIVTKGSTARQKSSPSWMSYVKLRDTLVKDGKLAIKNDELFEFTVDVEFNSPSAAAAVSTASNRNGRIVWKLEDGRTYAQWKQEQLDKAEAE